jgi:hypothetical protein
MKRTHLFLAALDGKVVVPDVEERQREAHASLLKDWEPDPAFVQAMESAKYDLFCFLRRG